jgi:hypothetical protein
MTAGGRVVGCHGAARNGAPLALSPTPFSGERMRRILRKLLLLAQRCELLGRLAAKLQRRNRKRALQHRRPTSRAEPVIQARKQTVTAARRSARRSRPPIGRACAGHALTLNACPPPSCSTAGELAAVINKSSVATASDGPTQFGREVNPIPAQNTHQSAAD